MRFLLDTNIISEPLKPEPNRKIINLLKVHGRSIAIASVTYYEMLFGYLRLVESRKRDAIETFVRREIEEKLPILPYDEEAAYWHALEVARLSKVGRPQPHLDSQIAAIAAVNNLTLVTRNITDFQHFQNLTLENWFE